MKKNDLFSERWCEILFRHRNKDYGAYELRRETGHRYVYALSGLFFLIILAFTPIVVYTILNKPQKVKVSDPMKHITRFEGVRIKEARPVRREERRQVTSAPDATQEIHEKTLLSDVAVEEKKEDGETELDKLKDISLDSLEALIKEAKLEIAKDKQQTSGIVVDSIPQYPTGLADFMKWLNKYMVYPRICLERKQSGKVIISFIVEPTGDVTDIRVVDGKIRELNHEVLRVLQSMPKWIPGKRNGKPIRSQVTLPVEFEFDDQPFS